MSNGPQFYETGMGRRFYESNVPEIINALNKIGDELEKLNETLRKERRDPVVDYLLEYSRPLTPEQVEEMTDAISRMSEPTGLNFFDEIPEQVPGQVSFFDGKDLPFK